MTKMNVLLKITIFLALLDLHFCILTGNSGLMNSKGKVKEINSLSKIDEKLNLFIKCAKMITDLAYNRNFSVKNLEAFLLVQDMIFESFDGDTYLEEKLLGFLIEYLKKNIKRNNLLKISQEKPRWG